MTEKIIYFFYRQPHVTREQFHRWYLDEHYPLVIEHVPVLRRYVVDLVDKPEGEPSGPDEDLAAFDGAVELYFDSVDDFADKQRMYDTAEGYAAAKTNSAAMIRVAAGYRVEEHVQRDYERDWPDGERSPGVKMLTPISRLDGVSREQFAERWTGVHAKRALEHVPGMWRYVTNVVLETVSPGAPEIDGIVEVHRRSAEDLKLRPTPEGQAIMDADTDALIVRPRRNQCSEYILKS